MVMLYCGISRTDLLNCSLEAETKRFCVVIILSYDFNRRQRSPAVLSHGWFLKAQSFIQQKW